MAVGACVFFRLPLTINGSRIATVTERGKNSSLHLLERFGPPGPKCTQKHCCFTFFGHFLSFFKLMFVTSETSETCFCFCFKPMFGETFPCYCFCFTAKVIGPLQKQSAFRKSVSTTVHSDGRVGRWTICAPRSQKIFVLLFVQNPCKCHGRQVKLYM